MNFDVYKAYRWATIILSAILVAGTIVINIAYTNHLQHQSDQRWCAILTSLTAPDNTQPTTERGRQLKTNLMVLSKEFDCQ